jgi:hypothetical protein
MAVAIATTNLRCNAVVQWHMKISRATRELLDRLLRSQNTPLLAVVVRGARSPPARRAFAVHPRFRALCAGSPTASRGTRTPPSPWAHRVPPYIAPPQFCAREAAGAGAGAGDEMRTAASGRRRVGPGTKGVFEGLWRKNMCGPFRCFVMWSVCHWDRTARSWLFAGRSTFTGSEVDGRWPVRRPRPNGHQKWPHHLQPLGMTRANTQWARGVRWPSGHVRNSGSSHECVPFS